MRGPSMRAIGCLMVPGIFVGSIGTILGALALANFVGRLVTLQQEDNVILFALPAFVVFAGVTMWLTACPRCGRSTYSRGRGIAILWPVSICTKCGLDLRRHTLLDPEVRRERRRLREG